MRHYLFCSSSSISKARLALTETGLFFNSSPARPPFPLNLKTSIWPRDQLIKSLLKTKRHLNIVQVFLDFLKSWFKLITLGIHVHAFGLNILPGHCLEPVDWLWAVETLVWVCGMFSTGFFRTWSSAHLFSLLCRHFHCRYYLSVDGLLFSAISNYPYIVLKISIGFLHFCDLFLKSCFQYNSFQNTPSPH